MPEALLGTIPSWLSGHDYGQGTEKLLGSSGVAVALLDVGLERGLSAWPLAGSTWYLSPGTGGHNGLCLLVSTGQDGEGLGQEPCIL